jgi:uncharacterized membrane protein YgdD (TMEM256/DUF423 family)
MNHTTAARIAAGLAMLGVAYGAFGAHALEGHLKPLYQPDLVAKKLENWKTAVYYQLFHAVAMYMLAVTGGSMKAWGLFAGGVLLFSGSLYGLVLWELSWLGPVTPVGGVLLIGGWALLMIRKREAVSGE